MNGEMNNKVAVSRVEAYDAAEIKRVLLGQFERIRFDAASFAGKKVVLKPNLVVSDAPDKAATTHPAVTQAAAEIARENGGDVVIAESPGGPYTEVLMKRSYNNTGTAAAAEAAGVRLNFDFTSKSMNFARGSVSKYFEIITPIAEADIIINLCKLKTHTLTTMSCAMKNLFGTIPGTLKIEQHARFANQRVFQSALVDLCDMLCSEKTVLHVCDAVVGMEGDGPTGGTPRGTGLMLSSLNPYALDAAAAGIIELEVEDVPMLSEAKKRGLYTGYEICGDEPGTVSYKQADGRLGSKFDLLPAFLKPRPVIIKEKCTGCGTCTRSCPAKTIEIKDKLAVIRKKNCIRCFCCQEMCPKQAVRVKKNIIFKILS